jgi:hypothetical protein
MSNLVWEILLRLAKAAAALVLGLVLYVVLTGPLAVGGSAELALLCWLSAAAFILLVETSPI